MSRHCTVSWAFTKTAVKSHCCVYLSAGRQRDHFSVSEGLQLCGRERAQLVHVHGGDLGLGQAGELIGVEQAQDADELGLVELADLLGADGLQLDVAQRHQLRGVDGSDLCGGEGLELTGREGGELLGVDGRYLCVGQRG